MSRGTARPQDPGFYHRTQSVTDLVQFVVGKVLDRLRLREEA